MSALGSKLSLWLLQSLAWVPLPVLRLFGSLVGLWAGYLPGRRYQTCLANLRLCYPEQEDIWCQSMARKSLMHEARTLLEMPRLWRLSPERIESLAVRVSGFELLEQARAQGKGIVLVTPHLGSWEFSGLYLTGHVTIHSMYRPLKPPVVDQFVRQGRQHTGAVLAPADVSGVRTLLRALQERQAVGILPDHVPRRKEDGVMAPFFGVPANTDVLVSRLARRQGVVVLLIQSRRCRGGFHVSFHAADPRVYSNDRVEAATGINAMVEAAIAEGGVAQYWWSYPRFRKRLIQPESLYP